MTDVMNVSGVAKTFPPNVIALEKADLNVRRGEVHCILGANGAGKSTLLKIIAGAIRPTSGTIAIDGETVQVGSPSEASEHGISMIYQELDLVPQLTVEQNLYLGQAPSRMGVLDKAKRRAGAIDALRRVGAGFSPDRRVETLSVANQQLTAIARSLTKQAKVIIMDEPSAALNEAELERVFEVIRELTAQGVAIIYVSHRLGELREIGDRVTVLRGGATIDTFDVDGTDDQTLVEAVVGSNRSLLERHERPPLSDRIALKVDRLKGDDGLDISGFEVRWGEISGLTGLNGSGRTSFLRSLYGVRGFTGQVKFDGESYHPRNPAQAISRGVGLVPENRKTEGLILDAPIYTNATLPMLKGTWAARHAERKRQTVPVLAQLSTKYGHPEQKTVQLSGGNQQKVVLAKWVIRGSRLLLLDEPSRGLDVGAKADLYDLVSKLAADGAAVIVASSELDELHAHCDRIWVFHEGRNVRHFDPAVTDQDTILKAQILGEHHD